MSNISLTASMRSNLLSLQNTQSLMDMTQERLSTGKKVNSAIDNPSSYYTAQSLTNRAGDLSALLDSMGQAIQTIKAADEGINAITSFAEQAKAVAQSASDTTNAEEVKSYMKQFDDIRNQITGIANDSGYKGVNLLNNGNLTVKFSENGSNLAITGKNATAEGLQIADVSQDAKKWVSEVSVAANSEGAMTEGTYVKHTDGVIYKINGSAASFAAAAKEATNLKLNASGKAYVADKKSNITTAMNSVSDAITKLRSMSSEFGNNYSIVQSREDFTKNLINV
ncbi:MAG: hypothetical protein IKA03_04575, partial [Alphaproteobacteria bacterium]|nr:hypothetical protein [Alphaproteobacteria bacterium]